MLQTGIVFKSTGSWYLVRNPEGQFVRCRLKGKVRLSGSRSTNPVAVGDWVDFEMEPNADTGVIATIHERRNHIVRKSVNLSRHAQVIAANLDLSLLVVTIQDPPTSFGFIDRFLVTCEAYAIPSIIVFNKTDLYGSEAAQEALRVYTEIYTNIGYRCLFVSAQTGTGLDELKAAIQNKTVLISGHSGVGKSTLVNLICPEEAQRTQEISEYHSKGQHTTTFAEMFEMPQGGLLIDTPGIKGFGLVDMEEAEIDNYFPEIFERKSDCKFHNCKHLNEPGCAVHAAYENGAIAFSRFNSYLNILNGIDDDTNYRKDVYA
jgi:ribosome biogenesis GTPase / thiamine phosphate phosphatase